MELHGVLLKRVLAFEALLAQRTQDSFTIFSRLSLLLHLLFVLTICKTGLLLEKCDKQEEGEEEEVRPIVPCPVCTLPVPVPVPECSLPRTPAAATGSRSTRQSGVGRQT